MNLKEELQTARLLLLQRYPYFAPLVHKITLIEEPKCPSMGVDSALNVYYNPVWMTDGKVFPDYRVERIAGLLLHEAMHVLLRHKKRNVPMQGKRPIDNIAMDCEINSIIQTDGVFKLPEGGVYPGSYELPDGETFEYYYVKLMEMAGQNDKDLQANGAGAGDCGEGATGRAGGYEQDPTGEGKGNPDNPFDGQGISELEIEMACDSVSELISKHPGNVAGGLKRYANARLAPAKVPWTTVLKRLLSNELMRIAGYGESGYHKLSVKSWGLWATGNQVALPARYDTPIDVVVGIDTSGSMGTAELQSAMTEINGIVRAAGATIRAFCIDTAVSGALQEIAYGATPILKGGGGTDMGAGIAYACKLKLKPSLIIIITDCYTPWPTLRPSIPVVVCAVGNPKPEGVPHWAKLVVAD